MEGLHGSLLNTYGFARFLLNTYGFARFFVAHVWACTLLCWTRMLLRGSLLNTYGLARFFVEHVPERTFLKNHVSVTWRHRFFDDRRRTRVTFTCLHQIFLRAIANSIFNFRAAHVVQYLDDDNRYASIKVAEFKNQHPLRSIRESAVHEYY